MIFSKVGLIISLKNKSVKKKGVAS